MAKDVTLFLSGLSSLSVVERRDSASADWYFIPARRMTSRSISDKQMRQSVRGAIELARLSIILSASRSDFCLTLAFEVG